MSDDDKRRAAEAALAELRHGMRIGLGTGSTARHFVDLLGGRVADGFECLCVPTSEETAGQAAGLGIPLTDLDTVDRLDLTVDGADEIGPGLALIKGAGGALLREKIVASASARMVVIADSSKVVPYLGRFRLPIEVDAFGLGATVRALQDILQRFHAEGGLVQRVGTSGEPYLTDGGHRILDASFGRISDPEALGSALNGVPGVVEHGLFLGICKRAYVSGPDGIRVIDA